MPSIQQTLLLAVLEVGEAWKKKAPPAPPPPSVMSSLTLTVSPVSIAWCVWFAVVLGGVVALQRAEAPKAPKQAPDVVPDEARARATRRSSYL